MNNNDENKKELSPQAEENTNTETDKTEETAKTEVSEAEVFTSEEAEKSVSDENNKSQTHKKGSKRKEKVLSDKTDKKSEKNPKQKMSKARFNHTVGAIIITAIVLVATVLLNVVFSIMSDKLPGMSLDLTSSGAFNLSDTSINLAKNVKKDLKTTFLSDKQSYRSKGNTNTYYSQVMSIAEEYGKYNSKISAEYISIVDNPNYANNYKNETLSSDNIIVSCGDKYRVLDDYDIFNVQSYYGSYSYIASSRAEEAFDGAILAVTSEETTNVTIATDNSTEDFSYFKNLLEQNNYKITEIKLESQDIPKDTDFLILLTPEKDYSADATNKILTFLTNGKEYGKNMLYVPNSKTVKTPNLDAVLSDWGITVGDGLAYELESSSVYGKNMYDGILCYLGSDAFTSNFESNSAPVICSYARPINLDSNKNTQSLLQYSASSGICPSDADDSYDFTGNAKGNVVVAGYGINGIAADDDKSRDKMSTIFVFGSSTMFEKTILGSNYSDAKYILAMMSEACGRVDQQIVVEAKELTQYDVTLDNASASVIGLIFYVGVPIVVVCAGIIVFFKRRNK